MICLMTLTKKKKKDASDFALKDNNIDQNEALFVDLPEPEFVTTDNRLKRLSELNHA